MYRIHIYRTLWNIRQLNSQTPSIPWNFFFSLCLVTHTKKERQMPIVLLTEFSLLSELSLVSIALLCSSSDIFARFQHCFNWWIAVNRPESMRKIAKIELSVRMCCDFTFNYAFVWVSSCDVWWKERPVKQYDACRCNFTPVWAHPKNAPFRHTSVVLEPLVAAKYEFEFLFRWIFELDFVVLNG